MKRHGDIFSEIVDFGNLLSAFRKASRGKFGRPEILKFSAALEDELHSLHAELSAKTYRPTGYRSFFVNDPKRRHISVALFRDRVVHHAFCNVVEPIFERAFVFDSYANRSGKGTHAAIHRVQDYCRHNRYVLKCDISRYFASVDHLILKQELSRRIKDPDALWLSDLIIDASNEQEFVNDTFPGDSLLAPLERRKGLPLGNMTSQFFGNVYLDRFDHFVKEKLRIRCYARYVDDFLAAGDDASRLILAKKKMEDFLGGFRLKLHPHKCHVLGTKAGVPFLGQVIFPEYRRLRNENVRRFRRRLKTGHRRSLEEPAFEESFRASIAGWKGHALQADTYRLRKRLEERFQDMNLRLAD